ncbi:MAG TPA: DEAD/DEAH box helicase [Phycisphaerales bacterium]|nr:DEAD/DEAH box helicase [Phycisphaerales bacterium]
MLFADISLSPVLLRALAQEGYTAPTPIQAQSIPVALTGKDVLGCAQTGTGKTAAFVLPILHRLMATPADKTRTGPAKARALILSPTRELASQIGESIARYGAESGLVHTVIFGGVSQYHQEKALRRGVDIIVATPGRLIDLMEQRLVDLREVKFFVLDEADRMLDMGFINPIRQIAREIPKQRQTLLFSATMPGSIMELADSLLTNPTKVSVAPQQRTADKIDQSLFFVPRMQKFSLLELLLKDGTASRVVVFSKTKHGAEKLGKRLGQSGINAETIHGNKAQNARKRALDCFRSGKARVLVATDVAARGLDIDDVTHVINYDLPMEPEAYVHRIGRTARAGASGKAISFCDHEERGLLRDIEKLLGKKVPVSETPDLPKVEWKPEPREGREGRFEDARHNQGHRHNDRISTQPFHQKGGKPAKAPAMKAAHQNGKPRRSFGFDQPLDAVPANSDIVRGDAATRGPRVFGAKSWTGAKRGY